MSGENKILIPVGVVILILLIGAGAWSLSNRQGAAVVEGNTTTNTAPGNQVPASPANMKIAEDVPHYMGTIGVFSGKITAINNKSLTLNGKDTVSVDENTEIYSQGPEKGKVAYQKELDAFYKKIEEANKNPNVTYVAPDSFEHEAVAFSSLNIGDDVLITPARVEGDTIFALKIMQGAPAAR
jgi:hypothetical protein